MQLLRKQQYTLDGSGIGCHFFYIHRSNSKETRQNCQPGARGNFPRREFEGGALISNRFSARKTNRSCNQSFSVRKSYHGKGYVLRRRPQAEQGRFWDIRIPKTAADFRLWERRVEKQPAAH